MQVLLIVIEWIAAFLLAVEAIKIPNLMVIRDKLMPIKSVGRDIVVDVFRTFTAWGMVFLTILFAFYLHAGWDGTGLFAWVISTNAGDPYVNYALWLALGAGWLFYTWVFGSVIHWLLWTVASAVILALQSIETNTHNGVVGLIGFALFTVVALMKLFIH
jgi:hypothetical protein